MGLKTISWEETDGNTIAVARRGDRSMSPDSIYVQITDPSGHTIYIEEDAIDHICKEIQKLKEK